MDNHDTHLDLCAKNPTARNARVVASHFAVAAVGLREALASLTQARIAAAGDLAGQADFAGCSDRADAAASAVAQALHAVNNCTREWQRYADARLRSESSA